MITIVCLDCGLGVRTVGDAAMHLFGPGSDWYPDKYPCVSAYCKSKSKYVESIDSLTLPALRIADLTPEEAFAAFNGLGLPGEHDCGKTAVEHLFKMTEVRSVSVRQLAKQNRSVINFIEFKDGTKLFLASSSDGAVVYRISKPHSYAEAVGG